MNQRIKSRYAAWAALSTVLWSPAALAAITITFFPSPDGGTMANIVGSGVKMTLGSGNALNWANLIGGNPFDTTLESTELALEEPITFTLSANITGFNFDNDGNDVDMDDFTIRFSDLFAHMDTYLISGTSRVLGLNFFALTPGTYTRSDNTVGGITIIISGAPPVDSDNDGTNDGADNCNTIPNPDQRDTDEDNIGNACDADFNQDCAVNFVDISIFSTNFLGSGDLVTDMNGDGQTNFADLSIVAANFLMPVGPSGLPNDCE